MPCLLYFLKHDSPEMVIVIIKLKGRKSKNKNGKVVGKLNNIRTAKIQFTVSLHPHNKESHHGSQLPFAASKPWLLYAHQAF